MKQLFRVLVAFTCFLLSLSQPENLTQKRIIFDYEQKVTREWNRETAEAYRDLAGLGYVRQDSALTQLAEIEKFNKGDESFEKRKVSKIFKTLFQIQKWEHIMTYTGGDKIYNYSFTIIRHKQFKKVVFAFSGTTSTLELLEEALSSDGNTYFRNNKSNVMIMSYFQELYQIILEGFYEGLERAKDAEIDQYIFVGHSLGGAMASISLFDAMKIKKIDKTLNSPVLITYGQPRTGNYAFANEVSKKASIIFRHVNNYDLIVAVPLCQKNPEGYCKNEYNESEVKRFLPKNEKDNPEEDYYPWHLSGLIFNYGDRETNHECARFSETKHPGCILEYSLSIRFHTYYYGHKVNDIWNPEYFPYDADETMCDMTESDDTLVLDTRMREIWKEYDIYEIVKNYFRTIQRQFKESACKAFVWGNHVVKISLDSLENLMN